MTTDLAAPPEHGRYVLLCTDCGEETDGVRADHSSGGEDAHVACSHRGEEEEGGGEKAEVECDCARSFLNQSLTEFEDCNDLFFF